MASQVRQEGVASSQDSMLQGQAEVWQLMFAFADSMAVKCAVELRIPDIIHSYGSPMSLSQIASKIGSSAPDVACLSRVMRLLVRKKIFAATTAPCDEHGEIILYGLTHSSKWLLHDSDITLAPMFKMLTEPWMIAPSHQLSATIKEGGTRPFEKAHGCTLWELTGSNPEINKMFNDGLACTAKVARDAILSVYNDDGFHGVETLVDVGGGNGDLVAGIVKANWPRIKGINFDLQHVVQSAPLYTGVTHVAGDMFQSVPIADAIIMKWILHDWSDEDCLKILTNCKKAMLNKIGKLILVEVVLEPEGEGLFDDTVIRLDLLMQTYYSSGRERTQLEWTNLLKEAGFSRIKFVKIPDLHSVIEAYASA